MSFWFRLITWVSLYPVLHLMYILCFFAETYLLACLVDFFTNCARYSRWACVSCVIWNPTCDAIAIIVSHCKCARTNSNLLICSLMTTATTSTLAIVYVGKVCDLNPGRAHRVYHTQVNMTMQHKCGLPFQGLEVGVMDTAKASHSWSYSFSLFICTSIHMSLSHTQLPSSESSAPQLHLAIIHVCSFSLACRNMYQPRFRHTHILPIPLSHPIPCLVWPLRTDAMLIRQEMRWYMYSWIGTKHTSKNPPNISGIKVWLLSILSM